jgi:hypothetical protein
MPSSDFANANVNKIVDKLTTEESVKLIAGVGLWHTASIERLGIPAIKVRHFTNSDVLALHNRLQVSDGPNGTTRYCSWQGDSVTYGTYLRYSSGRFFHEYPCKVPSRGFHHCFGPSPRSELT